MHVTSLLKTKLLAFGVGVVCVLALAGCMGPQPKVQGFTAKPPDGPGQPFKVEALVENKGPGDGEVEVIARLTNKNDGTLIGEDSKDLQMEVGDKQRVLFEISLPPSVESLPPDRIEVQVEAQYPIQ